MGAAESTSVLAGHQELLNRFVGSTPIPLHDSFWSNLLSFPYPLTKFKPVDLDEATKEPYRKLVENNLQTQHFPKLVLHLDRVLKEATGSTSRLPLRAVNAVYFTRLFVKHLTESVDSREIWSHLQLDLSSAEAEAVTVPPGGQDVVGALVRCLFTVVASCDVNASTYLLHLEVVNLLLVLASTQMHVQPGTGGTTGDSQVFLDAMMVQKDLAAPVVRRLLLAYIVRLPMPMRAPLHTGASANEPSVGVLRKMGSAAAAVFLFPFYTYAYLVNSSTGFGARSPLADNSLLLLLLLLHFGKLAPGQFEQAAPGSESENGADVAAAVRPLYEPNVFRNALQSARDTDFGLAPSAGAVEEGAVRVPFAALYDTLGTCLVDDRSTLLLYSLVHGNSGFLEYLLVRADLDTLLMPLLEMLYNAPRRTPNQMYMLLIILLILSQDASFNANIHKLILPGVPWYRERLLPKTSLGSLMVVILIRTVKYNLSKLRDVYLHTNCLAALANMAPHCHQLSAYASQRLVSLFQMLAKKYLRLSEAAAHDKESALTTDVAQGDSGDAVPTELHIYTDFLRIVLEIINAILTYALPRNPEVVYALLHRQEVFLPFRQHPRFYELLENIFTVVDFFNVRMDDRSMSGEWSVEKVLEVVVANARSWRGDGMKMFTELRFTYEEELHPEEFFVPYIWTLVIAHANVPWDLNSITLFPARPISEALDEVFDQDAFDTSSEYTATPREEV